MSVSHKQAIRTVFVLCLMGGWSWWENWTWFQFLIACDVAMMSATLYAIEEHGCGPQK